MFPHDTIRPSQQDLLNKIRKAIQSKSSLIAHAPTGLGKTAAALAPAIEYAYDKELTILFLTSRFTHHQQAIETIRLIQEKHNVQFGVSDIIAKKSLCLQPNASTFNSNDFQTFCRKLRESRQCNYYNNIRRSNGDLQSEAQSFIDTMANKISYVDDIKEKARTHEYCPYEVAVELAQHAKVIIGDYYYMFHPDIREAFLKKINKHLSNVIVIVDEAHNLSDRLKDLYSHRLHLRTLRFAMNEAQQFGLTDAVPTLQLLQNLLESWLKTDVDERIVSRDWLIDLINSLGDYDEILDVLHQATEEVLAQRQRSAIQSIYLFLVSWRGEDNGFARILAKEKEFVTLTYRCLDPSLAMKHVKEEAHSLIMMSGTLEPLEFYKNILGVETATEAIYEPPFPKENAMHLIVPRTTTKFTARGAKQYQDIAGTLIDMLEEIPKNTVIFFPSYGLIKSLAEYLIPLCQRPIFIETPDMDKEQKTRLLQAFRQKKEEGAVLLACAMGSFGEGVDLPGDLLQAVIIVGLPLGRPNLETKSLIEYYDHQFHKGWEYGYFFPAFTKIVQNAGRCIRSDKDRGVVIYLDERYAWESYKKCFPQTLHPITTVDYKSKLRDFFRSPP